MSSTSRDTAPKRPSAPEIEDLAADHAAEAGRLCKAENEVGTDRRIRLPGRICQNLEGQRLQRVADEDGGRLVIGLVDRRLAPAHVVVVHGRHVVVDEGVAMDELNGRTGGQRPGLGAAQHPRRLHRQERAQTLAAAEHGMAHGLHQPRGTRDLARLRLGTEAFGQKRLDGVGHVRKLVGKRLRCVRLDRSVGCFW